MALPLKLSTYLVGGLGLVGAFFMNRHLRRCFKLTNQQTIISYSIPMYPPILTAMYHDKSFKTDLYGMRPICINCSIIKLFTSSLIFSFIFPALISTTCCIHLSDAYFTYFVPKGTYRKLAPTLATAKIVGKFLYQFRYPALAFAAANLALFAIIVPLEISAYEEIFSDYRKNFGKLV